jgi:hypothetical protein
MITIRDYFILNPVWKLIKQLSVKDGALGGGSFRSIKEVYVKDGGVGGGSFRKVYNNNVSGATGSQHPFWRFSLDSDFSVNDQTSGDGLASDLYYTFWSNGNSGTYSIASGTARININNIDTTFTAGADGYYVYSTDTGAMFCNFTNGSSTAITFNGSPPAPVDRTGADGQTYRWDMLNTGAPNPIRTGTATRIQSVVNNTPSSGLATITMSRTAQATVNGYTVNLTRTYPSSYVPPTSGYYSHSGYTRMISNYELAVSPGQVYRIGSDPTATGTLGGGTGWGMNAYTSGTSGQAVPFGSGSTAFESTTWTDGTDRTFDITIPGGHSYLRVGIFISHNSTTSTNSPPTTPQFQRFDYLTVNRIS